MVKAFNSKAPKRIYWNLKKKKIGLKKLSKLNSTESSYELHRF